MGHYVRILTPSLDVAPLAAIRRAVEAEGVDVRFECEDDDPSAWSQIDLTFPGDVGLCTIERNAAADDSLVGEEIDEFVEEIADVQPASAVAWLNDYLRTVRTIYRIQIYSASDRRGGWDVIGAAKTAIWNAIGGIFQADSEWFSNEDGYHILWQFNDTVDGDWWMAVLENGRWVTFQMDLADKAHRAAFKQGRIPPGVTPAAAS